MKKNILIIAGVLFIALFLILLYEKPVEVNKNNKTQIVTSFYPMYIAGLNLLDGIEEVELKNLTNNATGCVHDYTLTPQEMMSLSHASAIIINGSGMESFLKDIIKNYNDIKVIDTSKGLEVIEEDRHGINPHTFVSIENYIIQVENMYNGLLEVIPEYEERLKVNKQEYINELKDLQEYGNNKLMAFKKENVVALHNSFEYFAKDFELNVIAVIEHEEGTAASATDIAQIINDITNKKVKVIVSEKDGATNTAQTIAKETKAVLVEFDPCLTGKNEQDAYIKAYTKNIDLFFNALNGGV